MRYLAAFALATLTMSIHAGYSKDKDIPLGGVRLGMGTQELTKLAAKTHRSLEGPGKRLMAADVRIFVQDYVVGKDKQIQTVSGARRQIIMLLNYKVIGVELWFKSKSSYISYLARLKKVGYVDKDGMYVGKILTGEFAGREVQVKTGTLASGRSGRTKLYTVQATCFEVLGKGITAQKIIEAQKGDGVRGNQEKRGMGRAL